MVWETTIDGAGRLVVPKGARERLHLTAGARVRLSEEDGRLVLSSEIPEPRLHECDGFLVVDFGGGAPVGFDTAVVRNERIQELMNFAMRK